MLNEKQKIAFEYICENKNILITSQAGTGKTFLINYICENLKTKNIAVTATTGISSILIGGTTIYSYLGIGLGLSSVEELFNQIYLKQKESVWKIIDILIIDEISMLPATLFDKLNILAKKIRKNQNPFGGIQLVLAGDFLQLPVISDSFVFNSNCWNECVQHIITLDVIVRQKDLIFKNVLSKMREGIIDEDVKQLLNSRVDKEYSSEIKPTKLFCLKKYVEEINTKELFKLKEQKFKFYQYVGTFKKKTMQNNHFEESKKFFIKNSTTQVDIKLCQNSQVMLTYNIDIANSLVNGSRGVVKGFTKDHNPIVMFQNNIIKVIKEQTWSLFYQQKEVGIFTQIPLKIAYALTIHSCQGLTLDCVEINLSDAFEFGQIYTAISRIKDINNLYLKNINYNKILCHPEALKFYKMLTEGNEKFKKNEFKKNGK